MRIVLDTNILLQIIPRQSRYRPIWNAYLLGRFDLVVTVPVLFEYEEILTQRTSLQVSVNIVSLMQEAANTLAIDVYYEWNIIKADPDDNKFTDAAIAGNADYLVTNDAHFNEVKKLSFPKLNVISAEEFLNIILSSRS